MVAEHSAKRPRGRTNPSRSSSRSTRIFAERLGERYSWDNPHWVEFAARVADWIIEAYAPETVLDAGCGFGLLVGALRERGVQAFGIDAAPHAISQIPAWLAPYCRLGSIAPPNPSKAGTT